MDKISVIVPVYKVEEHLPKCIESIINQTYKNLEIILVDDGSPDNCGKICDEHAKKDERIRVIHKENGGLSDARNKGIDIATGEYIAFLDSDDYIAPEMLEVLYKRLKEDDSDLALCNYLCVDGEYNTIDEKNQDMPIKDEVISGLDALKRLREPKEWYYVVAWNKLYKKEIFDGLRYPFKKIHEDEFLAHHIFGRCEKVSCIEKPMYYYLQRSDGIMRKENPEKIGDMSEAYQDRAIYLHKKGYYKEGAYFELRAMEKLFLYRKNNKNIAKIKALREETKKINKMYLNKKISIKIKAFMIAFNLGFIPYSALSAAVSFGRKV